MAIEQFPAFEQNETYSAAISRRAMHFWLARDLAGDIGSVSGGVVGTSDCIVSAPVSGMSVNIATGEAVVPGTSSTTQSGYYTFVSSITSAAVATANPSNPRIDVPCLTVNDIAYGAGSDGSIAQVITGTPSGSPVAPSFPATSLGLADVTVPAAATNIITGDITDIRPSVGLGIGLGNIFTVITTSTSIAAKNLQFIKASGTNTITVPVAAGSLVAVQNSGSGVITVAPVSGTISGGHTVAQSNLTINAKGGVVFVAGDGTNANVISSDYTPGNGIQLGGYVAALSGQDATTIITGGSTQTLPSPATWNRVIYILSANLTISGWTSPQEGQWLFVDIEQPASGTTTNTVTWPTSPTMLYAGGTKPAMTTGASAKDAYAVKYTRGAFRLYLLGQNES